MESSLVRFPHGLPPAPLWAEAGHDAVGFGAALDRVFGGAGDLHLIEHVAASEAVFVVAEDPLVVLAHLTDGADLPMSDPLPAPMPELAAVYDVAADGHQRDLWVYDACAA
jgi:hypothetical protein